MHTCPCVLIAGTQSGVGKTSLTLSLVAQLHARGLRVQTFKVGPDFLDPTYLSAASDRPCYNLDSWMAGDEYVKKLFSRTTADADIAVIEGVMGLFDGADPCTIQGSSAEIARILDVPVVLIVNAHGMSRSIAAQVKGYCTLEPGIRISGIIANRSGGEQHCRILKQALAASDCPPLVGCVPRDSIPQLPSRHLGLVTADRKKLKGEVIDQLANAAQRYLQIDDIIALAKTASKLCISEIQRCYDKSKKKVRIAIAWDEAFHFYYQDLFDELQFRGAELIRFSPIHDRCIPPESGLIYLGGGYPEEFGNDLAGNTSMLNSLKSHIKSGKPVYAECGGLMYLSNYIESHEGEKYSMTGLLPFGTRMLARRKSLGYVNVTLETDTIIANAGSMFRGHEFHYSEICGDLCNSNWRTAYFCDRKKNGETFLEGYVKELVLASYMHLYLASNSDALDRIIHHCRGALINE